MPRVVVIGAGAAGTVAAIFAARAGAEVTLVERTAEGGKKILISGGGRCNILPAAINEARFVTDSSPHSLGKILRSWPLEQQRAFFERDLGIALVEEPGTAPGTGKLFPCSNKARQVRDALIEACRGAGAKLHLGRDVRDIVTAKARGAGTADDGEVVAGWRVVCSDGVLEADAVILATGGLSVPATGSDGFGIRIARNLGHAVNPLYAALTPVIAPWASDRDVSPLASLPGVSVTATVTAEDAVSGRRATSTGGFLFTHHGYSGPAVLDVSHVLARAAGRDDARLLVKWTPRGEEEWGRRLAAGSGRARHAGVVGILREDLPARLAQALMAVAGVPAARTPATLRREERLRLIGTLTRGVLPWSGHAGYAKAEVTGGGVSLGEVNPRTLESRIAPGIFLAGEMLDAFGPIGGYNFAWAWATGRAAGIGAAAPKG